MISYGIIFKLYRYERCWVKCYPYVTAPASACLGSAGGGSCLIT
uniref:Uncharacterized protein n=1 Tax=Anguilla anguilla TaxID=7936 RepID=A0A0E9XWD2_ANGAN